MSLSITVIEPVENATGVLATSGVGVVVAAGFNAGNPFLTNPPVVFVTSKVLPGAFWKMLEANRKELSRSYEIR